MEYLGVLLATVGAIGLAGQALFTRSATVEGKSSHVVFYVLLIHVIILVPLSLIFSPGMTLTRTSILLFATAGVVATMLGRAFFFAGIKRIGASRAEPIKGSMPLFATSLAVILLGETVTSFQFIGIVTIIVGLIVLSYEGRSNVKHRSSYIGFLLPLIAAVLYGFEPILASLGFAEGTSVLDGLVVKSLAALVTYSIYILYDGQVSEIKSIKCDQIHWYILSGISATVFLLGYYSALNITTVGVVTPITQTSPLFVIIGGAIFFRGQEAVNRSIILGALIIVVGSIIVAITG